MNVQTVPAARCAKHEARRRFDDWSGRYDRSPLNYFLFRPSHLAILEQIAHWRRGRTEGFRVLDIGCGTATLAGLLLNTPWPVSVVGVDLSTEMCAAASRKGHRDEHANRATIVAGDSEHLPFDAGSFDLATCANSFHHYPRQQAVLMEMRRILRPGGAVIVLDGFRDNAVGWFVFDVIVAGIERDVHHVPWHEMHALFANAGLRNIRRRKTSFLFPTLATIADV